MKKIFEWVDKDGNKITTKNVASAASAGSEQATTDMWSTSDSWDNFVDKITKYIESQPELSDFRIDSHSRGKLQVLHIFDISPGGENIIISFNVSTELFEINASYDGFDIIKGEGFNYLMQLLNDISFSIFELGRGFNFLSLRESLSKRNKNNIKFNLVNTSTFADDFKLYESLWN